MAENEIFNWEHNGETISVDFWDTAGQEAFCALRTLAYTNTNVMIIGFDMTNHSSLENILSPADKCWKAEVMSKLPDFDHWILVGTKHDMWEQKGGTTLEQIYKVPVSFCLTERLPQVAEELQPKEVIFTSAFTKHNCKVKLACYISEWCVLCRRCRIQF